MAKHAPDQKRLSVTFQEPDHERLEKWAQAEKRSLANLIEWIVTTVLDARDDGTDVVALLHRRSAGRAG